MHVNITYDEQFTELMLHLKAKYGQKLFDLDGIGSQLDIDMFSKGFFTNTSTTADVSVDSNSNVSTKDMIVYNTELPKPYFRLNAYYLVWKKLRQLYTQSVANRIIESQLSGDIYINDFHGVSQPYSYHPDTKLIIRHEGVIYNTKISKLFSLFKELKVKLDDRETIDTTKIDLDVYDKGRWVKLKHILRHKSHTDLKDIRTKGGGKCVVTYDHPVILSDGTEKEASAVTVEDFLMVEEPPDFEVTETSYEDLSDEIVSIEDIAWKGEWVYDITTETGTFYSNGLTVHNCYNYSTYDIALNGLTMVNKIKSIAPKHLYSFKSQLEQFVVIASNSTLGSCGLADMLIVMAYYVDRILETKSDAGFSFATEEDCWKYVKENIVSFIYTINQPSRSSQCVTADTEVLTPKGFKNYSDLRVGHDIYTWNDGKLNIQKVEKVNVYDHNGRMHKYSGRDTVQVVTPNHMVLHKKHNHPEYVLTRSSELIHKKTKLTYPVAMLEYDRPDFDVSDDLIKFCVLILSSGTISNELKVRNVIVRSSNEWVNKKVKELLEKYGITYELDTKPSPFGARTKLYYFDIKHDDSLFPLLNFNDKRFPEWFTQLSKRQASLVIDTWLKIDVDSRSKRERRKGCKCNSYTVASQLQHVCFLAGRGSWLTTKRIKGFQKETYYLIPYSSVNKTASKKEVIKYKGKVWCPTTKDGVVVFRKDGRIFVSGNSPFTNVSIFDKNFLEGLAPEYVFPDGKSPKIETINKVQELFIDTMNEELRRTPVTFPVTTACFSVDDGGNILDENFLEMISEKNLEFAFINLYCGKTSTLSSCCRLRSDTTSDYFNTLGSGGTQIGSLGVVTINLPRMAYRHKDNEKEFFEALRDMVEVAAKINNSKRHIIKKKIANGTQPLYSLGFMDIKKQYSTCGLNGINEAVKIMGYDILNNGGVEFALKMLDVVNKTNDRMQKQYKSPHNCEQTPSENSSIKLANKDKLLGIDLGYSFYSNQFIPLITEADLLDRIRLQGIFDKHFSGGCMKLAA